MRELNLSKRGKRFFKSLNGDEGAHAFMNQITTAGLACSFEIEAAGGWTVHVFEITGADSNDKLHNEASR